MYSIAEKKTIMKYARENSYSAATKRFNVDRKSLYAWAKKSNEWDTGNSDLRDTIRKLSEENMKLREALSIFIGVKI